MFKPITIRLLLVIGLPILSAALLLEAPAMASAQDMEREHALQLGNQLIGWLRQGNDCDEMLSLLPAAFIDTEAKRQAMRERIQRKREAINAWLQPYKSWELGLLTKREDGNFKVRYRFYLPQQGKSLKPKYKTLHFIFSHGAKWKLIYVGGWELESGSIDFWP